MEDFEIKSLDELDKAFIQKKSDVESAPYESIQAPEQSNSIIPDFAKSDFDVTQSEFEPTPIDTEKERLKNEYLSHTITADTSKPFSIPAEKSDGLFGKKAIPFEKDNDVADDDYEDDVERHSTPGTVAAKVVSIVMLSVTVLIFVLGCFLSIFIDNNGAAIGASKLSNAVGTYADFGITKGSLIVSNSTSEGILKKGDPVAIECSDNSGSEIYVVQNIATAYNSQTQITAIPANGGTAITLNSQDGYNVVKYYFPAIGGIIHFAMSNMLIVCALFLLLSALWILILILAEKKETAIDIEI